MGLIERAIDLGETNAKPPARDRDGAPARGGVAAQLPESDRTFDLDFAALAEQGFYTPGAVDSRQALELRAIKRRILRRIGFLQRAGQDKRALQRGGRQRNLILVTSTRPGEGKTFSAINLALSFAAEDRHGVLLVDADAPRPKVLKTLGLNPGPGLTDKLANPKSDLGALCRKSTQLPLEVLGEGANTSEAPELLAAPGARRAFAELSQEDPSRLVIIDAPPVLATTEAIILAQHVDEIVFVVEADATPQPAVAAALDELLELNSNVSLLLNRCLIGAGGSHYGAYEHYERSPKGARPATGVASRADAQGDRGNI